MAPFYRISIILLFALAFGTGPSLGQNVEPVSSLPDLPPPSFGDDEGIFPLGVYVPGVDVLAGEAALSEVSIDVNPTNRDNLVIVGHSASFNTMNTFFSTDGGQTWTAVPLGNAADGLTSTFRFDPTVAFDDNGNVYVGYGVRTPAPGGGNQRTVVVCTSTDGGATYPQCAQLDTNPDIGTLPGNDKWHLATGPDPVTPAQQNVYIAWTKNVTEPAGTDQRIVVSRSTDGGATWSAALTINDASISGTQSGNLFADPAVGPNGELYVAWHDIGNNQVLFDASTDGGATFGSDVVVTGSSAGFKTSIPAQPDRGVGVGPVLDTDRSGGVFDGQLYLTYADLGPGGLPDVNIYVRSSSDGGATWSGPVLVNDDGGTNSQFLPWVDVDQVTGQVVTVWYDARNDTDNKQVEVFLAVSEDGGASFDTNVLVADNASDMSTDNAARYSGNFLEYIGVAALNGVAVPVWADNSESGGDLDYYVDLVAIGDPPVADAGPDQTVECISFDGAEVTLDGSGSVDPDGDPLTYTWRESGSIIAGPTTDPTVVVTLSLGVHTIELTVDDGNLHTDTDEVVITVEDTTPPEITLLGDNPLVLECGIDDYVEPGATVSDICDPNPTLEIDASEVDTETPGTYTVHYTATDASDNSSQTTRTVEVVDTTPPVITVNEDPASLWPPNRKYHAFSLDELDLVAEDACDETVSAADIVIASISSDEPEDAVGEGDGATLADIVIDNSCRDFEVRAERQGPGNGRVYTIELVVADASGNVSLPAFYMVHVPHDIELGPLGVDDGPAYTVDGCDPLAAPEVAAGEAGPAREALGLETASETPDRYALAQNYPNPFNPSTEIEFSLPESAKVELVVYDVTGREVARLVDRVLEAGVHRTRWVADGLPSATYLYRLTAGVFSEVRYMILVK